MNVDRKLAEWQSAGVIDAATARSIGAYEATASQSETSRLVALWAVVAIGLLALGLGVMLIVAANWDRIPPEVKLTVQLALTAAAAGAVWSRSGDGRDWAAEAALFLLGVIALAGIGLHAQVYQLVRPIWEPLLLWALLAGPAFLLLGRTRLTAYALGLMLTWLALSIGVAASADTPVREGLALALPAALVALSCRRGGDPSEFENGLLEFGLGLLLLGASLAHFAWAIAIDWESAVEMIWRLPAPLSATALAVIAGRQLPPADARVLTAALVAAAAAVIAASAVPHPDSWAARLTGAVIYAAMWVLVGKTALDAGWRLLFNVAIGAVAARLFIIYFELFGTLATTGIGLVAAGLLTLALAFAWHRLTQLQVGHRVEQG